MKLIVKQSDNCQSSSDRIPGLIFTKSKKKKEEKQSCYKNTKKAIISCELKKSCVS